MNETSGIEEDVDPRPTPPVDNAAPEPDSFDEELPITAPIKIPRHTRPEPEPDPVPEEEAPLYNHLRHKMFIRVALIFLPLLALLAWVGTFYVGFALVSFVRWLGSMLGVEGSAPGEILGVGIPLVVSLVVTVWLAQRLLHRYVLWKHRYLRITKDAVSLPTEIESDFLMLISGVKSDHPVIPRSKDLTARVTQGWWGRKFGFAKVSFDGPGQKDEQFHGMRFISYPEQIKELFPK